jgi:predicted metalloprotease with PDZ domain
VNSSQLYYPKGALTGMLLDISMRDATDNAHGLDDVTRALYRRFYLKGKGFTTEHLLGLLREFGLPEVDRFYQRYINGREPLPYEAILPKAGINVTRQVTSVPFLGVNAPLSDQGQWVVQVVDPGSSAEQAGLVPGDVLVKVGDIETHGDQDWSVAFRRQYMGQAGAPLAITVSRDGRPLVLTAKVQERSVATFQLSRNPAPNAKQTKVWQALAAASGPGGG